jgi:hypothetical protein
VYLGTDSSLTITTRAFTLDPKGGISWPANSGELWAMTDPGNTVVVEQIYGTNFAFQPGPTNVNATIPGTVNTNVNNPIVLSGDVALITSYNSVINASTNVVLFDSIVSSAPLTNYSSLLISGGTTATASTGANPSVTSLFVEWMTPGGMTFAVDYPIVSSNGIFEIVIPVRANNVRVTAQVSALGQHTALPISLYAARDLLPRRYYNQHALLTRGNNLTVGRLTDISGAGMVGGDITQPTINGQGFLFIPSLAGPMSLSLNQVTGTANNVRLYVIDRTGTLVNMVEFLTSTQLYTNGMSLISPEAPLVVFLTGTSAGARAIFALDWSLK